MPSPVLTAEIVRELLDYDPETGIFKWKEPRRGAVKVGLVAGSIDTRGYRQIVIFGKLYLAHRLAWFLTHGEFPPYPAYQIDHINRTRDDNRIANLRVVTQTENMRNQSIAKNNKSGVIGVCWSEPENRWKAQIKLPEKQIHLGTFKNKDDAIAARKAAEIKYGFHENHGT